MKRPKNYPLNGPPRLVQAIKLGLEPKTKENIQYVKTWLKGYRQHGRPETVEAYEL